MIEGFQGKQTENIGNLSGREGGLAPALSLLFEVYRTAPIRSYKICEIGEICGLRFGLLLGYAVDRSHPPQQRLAVDAHHTAIGK
jgi:hypothetical protein